MRPGSWALTSVITAETRTPAASYEHVAFDAVDFLGAVEARRSGDLGGTLSRWSRQVRIGYVVRGIWKDRRRESRENVDSRWGRRRFR